MVHTRTMAKVESAKMPVISTKPPPYIPFETGPSLDRVPDDVLREILLYLPTLDESHVSYGIHAYPRMVPSSKPVRTHTLRALSQTSRLLRSRCIEMAWERVEFCGANKNFSFDREIGEATLDSVGVLRACSYLLPLIQTATVVLTRFRSDEIIPALADCLAALPNLTTIQIIYAHSQMTTAIKNGFRGKKLTSVRRIILPCSAHEILRYCPNLEEVICTDGSGSTVVGSLVQGKCQQVRVLKGISAPLTRLVKLLPNLRHITVSTNDDMAVLASFPYLDTIEIIIWHVSRDRPLRELVAPTIEAATKILKENESQAHKVVLLTQRDIVWGRVHDSRVGFRTEVITV